MSIELRSYEYEEIMCSLINADILEFISIRYDFQVDKTIVRILIHDQEICFFKKVIDIDQLVLEFNDPQDEMLFSLYLH